MSKTMPSVAIGDRVTSFNARPGSRYAPIGPVTEIDQDYPDIPVYRSLGGAVALYMTIVGMDSQWISMLEVIE
jgi:hypothetical protein